MADTPEPDQTNLVLAGTITGAVGDGGGGSPPTATELRDEGARWVRWIGALLFVVLVALGWTLWVLRSVDGHVDTLETEVTELQDDNAEMRRVLAFVDRLICDRLPDSPECQPRS
jgi:hypothetical protein